MINVVNKYKHTPTGNDFFIGRGSPLGNPFTSIKNKQTKAQYIVETKEISVNRYEEYLLEKIKNKDIEICEELNKLYMLAKENDINLVCYCVTEKNKMCHGNVIKRIIEDKLLCQQKKKEN